MQLRPRRHRYIPFRLHAWNSHLPYKLSDAGFHRRLTLPHARSQRQQRSWQQHRRRNVLCHTNAGWLFSQFNNGLFCQKDDIEEIN